MSRILIIDDDPDFTDATRIILQHHGYEVLNAGDGEEGLQAVRKHKPDLIILDVVMSSVLDGLNVSRRLHDDPEHRDIPILMVTSIANTDYAALFPTDEYIHIRGFLTKPVSAETLLEQVRKFLAKPG
jgi:CheY-like chemotaxis protein